MILPHADIPAHLFSFPILGKGSFVTVVFLCCTVRRRRQEGEMQHLAEFSITSIGASETADYFDTSQAEYFVTAKGLNTLTVLLHQPDHSIVPPCDY